VTESPLSNVELHLVRTLDDAFACKRWAAERRETPLGIDTESCGLNPITDRLRLLQLGDKRHGWVFPAEWAGAAIEIIDGYDGDFVAHNSSFDARVIKHSLGYRLPLHKLHDTMFIAALTDPLRPKGLKPLSARLIDRNATAGEKLLHDGMKQNGWGWATVPVEFPPYWSYSALDPVLTTILYEMLAPNVLETAAEAYDLERAVMPILASGMDHGLLLDKPYVKEKLAELERFTAATRGWLREHHGIESLMSAKQLHAALSATGVEITATTKTGLPSIDKESLDAVRVSQEAPEPARQLANAVLKARHAEKLSGTYLSSFLELAGPDGAIHPSIMQLQARTGRSSCTDPNLQNLPRDDRIIRGSFIPHPGCVLISCDASQVELRIAASVCGDENLVATIREADETGADIYCSIASTLFGETITKKDVRRQFTKNAGYCKIYGGGVRKIAATIGLPYAKAQEMNDMFDTRFPRLASYAGELIATARRQASAGEVPHTRTDTGRYLPCDDDRAYSLMNYAVQATAAEELKRAIIRLASAGLGDMFRLPVHDEVIMEVPADDAPEILKLIQDTVREDHRFAVSIPWEGSCMYERWSKTLCVVFLIVVGSMKTLYERAGILSAAAPRTKRYSAKSLS
jgi:DNA polymerase I